MGWCNEPVWVLFKLVEVLTGDQESRRDMVLKSSLFLGQIGGYVEAKALPLGRFKVLQNVVGYRIGVRCTLLCHNK